MPNNTILITPEHTLVAGKSMTPDTINVVLDNGHSYSIDIIIDLLEKHDKKTVKKPSILARTRRGITAFKLAMKETENTQAQ